MNINKGLILESPAPEDFVQGTSRSLEVKFGAQNLQPDGNWEKYLPEGERQNPGYETSMCVSSATSTAIEILANRVFKDLMNLSERMIAKLSGTDPFAGNTPKRVADAIYRQWSVYEQEWPTSAAENVQEFYAEIPENLKTLAIARGAKYAFGYQAVPLTKLAIKNDLKKSPVCISVPGWYKDENGKYYRPQGVSDGHWTVCYGVNENDEYLILDSYLPYKKVMRSDFQPMMAMSYFLELQVNIPPYRKFLNLIKSILGL